MMSEVALQLLKRHRQLLRWNVSLNCHSVHYLRVNLWQFTYYWFSDQYKRYETQLKSSSSPAWSCFKWVESAAQLCSAPFICEISFLSHLLQRWSKHLVMWMWIENKMEKLDNSTHLGLWCHSGAVKLNGLLGTFKVASLFGHPMRARCTSATTLNINRKRIKV